MTETIYLVVERSRYAYRGVRISRISKKRPKLPRPHEQALVRLSVVLPDNVLEPREVRVVVKSEDIVAPAIVVTSQPAGQ